MGLVLFPDAHNANDREILFTLETNEELAIWEDMKQEYLERTRATATSARVPATAPAPSPAPLDANPETDAADGPPPPSQGI